MRFVLPLVVPAPRLVCGLAASVLLLLGPAVRADESVTAESAAATARARRAEAMATERQAYAASANYNPYDTESRELLAAARQHLAKKKYAKAIADATKGLKKAPYNVDLLIVLETACRAAGETAKADAAAERWKSIVDSILETGDGRSFATAFHVIDIQDEYAVIRLMQLTPADQSLRSNGQAMFDVMQVKSPETGETFDLYFNISLPMKWMNRQFAGAKE
jgi:hypothetical protein